jgi:transcriptional regulator with XRE-family HTH domain
VPGSSVSVAFWTRFPEFTHTHVMASNRLSNYLLSHRKRSALSQGEVAFLLGLQSGARVCHYERFTKEPGLQTALAYEAIYGRPISELFPGLFEKIQDEVRARARTLEQQESRSDSGDLTTRKRQFLAGIVGEEITNQLQ